MANKKKTESISKKESIPLSKPLSKDDLQFQKLLQFVSLSKHIRRDLNSNKQTLNSFQKNFNKDDVMRWMTNPQKYEKQLRKLSRFLYDTSSHYKRLVQYFATMLTYDYTVEPYGMSDLTPTNELIETIKKKYLNIINYLDIMNLKHEFAKVMERAWIDDIFYGYEYRLKDSYFIDTLDPDYCEINGIEDGVLTFQFDFSYFNTRDEELERFADEFKIKYQLYKANPQNMRWQEIDSSKCICIKINENIEYCIPPFCGIFEEIYALEDYKQLKLAKTELENYLLLVAKIPYLKENNVANNFALEINKALEYFDLMMDNLPEQVGGILSPFESVESVKVDRTDKNSDNVSEAEKALYDSAGVSQLLFNSDSAASSVTKSIIVDASVDFKILRQLERWVNKKLKDENKVIKFKTSFLDITKYTREDEIKCQKEAASLGVPNKLRYAAAIGMTPSSALHMEFLENSVLGITDNWKPLSSSYTQTSDEGGRPQLDEDDLSSSGETTRKNDSNNKEARK